MNIEDVVAVAGEIKEGLGKIRAVQEGAVMFIDLVGSTEFKAKHPAEETWLPRLATFLLGITRIVEEKGRVVKYIGDEVMAFFHGPSAALNAEHAAENALEFCKRFTAYTFQVKISLDYGRVSMLSFPKAGAPKDEDGDPNGTMVDRCARIMSKATADTVLCSSAFRSATPNPTRWRRAGAFKAKGLKESVTVWQLKKKDQPDLVVKDDGMTIDDCRKALADARGHLEESRALRRAIPRSSRSGR